MKFIPYQNVRFIVVHYSATPIERPQTAADIDLMHRKRGFSGIGYHKFIRRDGTIENGRPLREKNFARGAHVKGNNTNSLGICFEGGVVLGDLKTGRDTRTVQQNKALIKVIDEMKALCPNAKVVGHRDMEGAATQCPAFDVSEWWARIEQDRRDEAARIALRQKPSRVAEFVSALLKIFTGTRNEHC